MLVPDSIDGDEKRPVMIWIHGGAFVSGNGHGNDVPQNQARTVWHYCISAILRFIRNL